MSLAEQVSSLSAEMRPAALEERVRLGPRTWRVDTEAGVCLGYFRAYLHEWAELAALRTTAAEREVLPRVKGMGYDALDAAFALLRTEEVR